jgi:hypothetical protein
MMRTAQAYRIHTYRRPVRECDELFVASIESTSFAAFYVAARRLDVTPGDVRAISPAKATRAATARSPQARELFLRKALPDVTGLGYDVAALRYGRKPGNYLPREELLCEIEFAQLWSVAHWCVVAVLPFL